ncbi:rubredoxin-like superfamily protein [Wolffia australiana]
MTSFASARAALPFRPRPISPSPPSSVGKIPFLISLPSPPRFRPFLRLSSVDVSKEDTPISDQEESFDATLEMEGNKVDLRRAEEKFVVVNTGVSECRSCGYLYDQKLGDPSYPVPPGLSFDKLPEDWRCPTCGAAKSFFDSKSFEIAGFAQNQQFGLGGNSLTSGQKVSLIYGTLAFFFILFLSGYFLQ